MNYWLYLQENIDLFKNHCVTLDHCIARVVLDNYFKQKWSDVIKKPASKNLSTKQHKEIIDLLNIYINDVELFKYANEFSLQIRKTKNNVSLSTFNLSLW